MNDCNCKPKNYQISLGCCQPVLGPIENYYTKYQVDQMLEEIESAITSGCCITPEEVDEKISVATDNMATEEWVINQDYITGVDLSDYVTFEDLPSLSGYATQQWVINQNYAFNSEVIQYITNLQNQIDSLKEQISGCCGSSGETITRWITMTGENDYTCSGTTKMTKEKEQSSTDGLNWVDTGNYRTGSTVLEVNSENCGFIPPIEPQYRWKAAPTSDYLCSGTSMYYKVYYEVSYDGGTTWQHVQPEQTKRGNLIEANSPACGFVPTPYKVKANYKIVGTTGTAQVNCDSSTTITRDEIKNNISSPSFLTSIEFGECVNVIGKQAFLEAASITGTVEIPSNVTAIKEQAFAFCNASSYILHEGLRVISGGAFSFNDITSIDIPNSVRDIGSTAFSYCPNLTGVTIGSGITHIGNGAFQTTTVENIKITSMVINATTPPSLDNNGTSNTFPGTYAIRVPAGSVNAYKAAWPQYASRIQAIP